jgi:hypothetical protein
MRNSILAEILSAYGGDPTGINTRNKLLELILTQNSGIATNPEIRNTLLADIITALGGVITNPTVRNQLLNDIVLAAAGTIRNATDRNMLLEDWLNAVLFPTSCRYYYNFDGFDDYISIPEITLASGDYVSVSYIARGVTPSNNLYIVDSTGIRCALMLRVDGTIFSTGVNAATIRIDGELTTTHPYDGKAHTITWTTNTACSIDVVGPRSSITAFSPTVIYDLKAFSGGETGTLIRSYAIDDNSSNIVDSVSGQDGTLINGTTGQWEYICEGSGAFTEEFTEEFS